MLLLSLLILQTPLVASDAPDDFSKADTAITSAYKQALTRFTPANKEMLRRGERAWITFSNKQEAVLNALQGENLLTEDANDAASIAELYARANHLRTFFVSNSAPTAQPSVWQNQDRELTRVYAERMARLGDSDQRLLKEEERAWIIYRDADSASTMTAYNNQTVQIAAAADLTALRVAQLQALLNQGNARPPAPEVPVQNVTPNPVAATTAAQFHDEAESVLKAFLAKKDDPFFKKADTLKTIPELPPDIADQISKLHSKYLELVRTHYSMKPLDPAVNEYAAVELLAGWSKFVRQLVTGSVENAGAALHDALDFKPKEVTPDYLPLWQTVQSWQDVFWKDEPKFDEHIRKARSLADLGKTSDAIKEYQAAYDIIENSSIPGQIKELRDQSLGL